MFETQKKDVSMKDLPLPVAILGFGVVLIGLSYIFFPADFYRFQNHMESYYEAHQYLLLSVLISLSVNAFWLISLIARSFGKEKQGSKLKTLTGKKPKITKKDVKVTLSAVGISLVVYGILYFLNFPTTQSLSPLFRSLDIRHVIVLIVQINYALSAFVGVFVIGRLSLWKGFKLFSNRSLPEMPKPVNGIVIGTVGEDQEGVRPEWVTLYKKALCGNILVTASPGDGKTQGTILPYLDQILENFKSPRPSILLLDPKGTFIPEALKIIEKHNLSEHVLHMKLGGDVSFNPIYSPDFLKRGKFLEIAQMIRAAAMNYSGKGSESPFWELSAFNLIKSSLVLCGMRHRGSCFGLTDLYNEMVTVAKSGIETSRSMINELPNSDFDEEEKFNIECASKYFEEFEQMDSKIKTGVLATSTAFLNQFQEYQAAQIFCPKDLATIKSMDEVVDEGKILLFDISNPALAKSMGAFVKLHYQQSVLNRMKNPKRKNERLAFIIADEYQDIVSSGAGMTIGDDRYYAMSREANGVTIAATQSITSLKNSIGRDNAAREIILNFRTLIAGSSTDIATVKNFQELVGQEDTQKVTHSVSESSHQPSRNLIFGGFDSNSGNISESVSTIEHKEYSVTGKEFSRLPTFESFALIYDGTRATFKKLFLKPYFLKKKNTLQKTILEQMKAASAGALLLLFSTSNSFAFPNACTVVKSSEFRSCLEFSVSSCMCGWPVPRPCANFSYYVPQTFIEVFPNAKSSYFSDYPGAAMQLNALGSLKIPFGAEGDDDTQSFHSHVISVPFSSSVFSNLPCDGSSHENTCFQGMSEHLGSHWSTGSADMLQPGFLAWSLSPKGCLLKGAATSVTGSVELSLSPSQPSCSVPMSVVPRFPPSSHSACTGWGVFYPRSGTYSGPSQLTGALMIASRMKSLGSEVFHATPSSIDEVWQMTYPQSSSCFREGQNVSVLESIKNVREIGRITSGKITGYLFTVWSKTSCCRDLSQVPAAKAALESITLACRGLGAL